MYLRLMAELDADGKHNSEQISEIDLTDPEDARVLMPEQGADILAHFGEDHFLERYQRYKAHIAEWRQQYPHLAAVDLRYDQQVVLEMASGKQAAQACDGVKRRAEAAAGKRQPTESRRPETRSELGREDAAAKSTSQLRTNGTRRRRARPARRQEADAEARRGDAATALQTDAIGSKPPCARPRPWRRAGEHDGARSRTT